MKLSLRINPKFEYVLGGLFIFMIIIGLLPVYKAEIIEKTLLFSACILGLYFFFAIFRIFSISKSIWGRLILILYAFLLIGALFKLTHWRGAAEIIDFAIIGMSIAYFFKKLFDKSETNLYRIVKIIYVFSLLTYLLVRLNYFSGLYSLYLCNRIILIFLIAVYLIRRRQSGTENVKITEMPDNGSV